jgi:hypothetical protein
MTPTASRQNRGKNRPPANRARCGSGSAERPWPRASASTRWSCDIHFKARNNETGGDLFPQPQVGSSATWLRLAKMHQRLACAFRALSLCGRGHDGVLTNSNGRADLFPTNAPSPLLASRLPLTMSNSPSRSRGAFLCPGFATLLHSPRTEGWAERRESFGRSGTRWACT